jgi:hypothetical protein
MTTIAAGQLAGMSRSAALEFSFSLSIPTMMAATEYDLLKSVMGKSENPIGISQIGTQGWLVLAIGIVICGILRGCLVSCMGQNSRFYPICRISGAGGECGDGLGAGIFWIKLEKI